MAARRQLSPAQRGVIFIAIVAAIGVLSLQLGHRPTSANPEGGPGPNGSTELEGPVPWVLLGAGPDHRSVVVLPMAGFGGCGYPWAVAKIPSPTIQIRASIRSQNCEMQTLELRSGRPVTVPVPGPIDGLNGRRIGGPGYQGVASRRQLNTVETAGPEHVGLPLTEELQLEIARLLLERVDARVEVVGPTGGRAVVKFQWALPNSFRPNGRPTSALLLTVAREGRGADDRSLTCALVRRYEIPEAQLRVFEHRVPKACRPEPYDRRTGRR